jgi:hypothetical protein
MKKRILLIALMLTGVRFVYSQVTEVNDVNRAQTLFIYNFSRLIQWPAVSQSGEFVIGVVGDNELFNALTNFVVNKRVGSQSILVKKFDEPAMVSKCHIVFIGNSRISRINEILGKLQGSNSLIITERKGMIHSGSAIDFFFDEDKLKFVINSDNAEKYNLIVSKSLEDMAFKN